MDNEKKKSLIKSLLSGRLTKRQRKAFADLVPVDIEIKNQWNKAGNHAVDLEIKEQIWKKIKAKCEPKKNNRVLVELRWYLMVASIALLLIIGGFWLNFKERIESDEFITVIAERSRMHILQDNTKVWMEAGSSIKYPKAFSQNRKVWLKGNSLFEVTKNSGQNFRVFIDKAFIEVKGTCFLVKQNNKDKSEITLMSGKIDFNVETTKECIPVMPMQRIIFNPQKGETLINEFTKLNWENGKFQLNDMSLTQLIQTINQLYNTNIIIKDNIKKESAFTGTIRYDEDLTDVLNKICFSLNLNINRTNEQIIIY